MSIILTSVTRWVLLVPLVVSLALDAPLVPKSLPMSSLRFNAVRRLFRAATRAGVEGLSNLEDASPMSEGSASEICDEVAVCLSPDDGIHGPCLVLKTDLPEHVCVLKVPWGCLVGGSSWAEDSSLGRALAHEGILHTAALLDSNRLQSSGDRSNFKEAILVTEGTEFQGSEPLLVLWLLLQNRWTPCDDISGENDLERAARRAYFEALDGPEVPDSIAVQCAFAWPEADIARLLAPSPTASRAVAARAEMQAAYGTLKALLARSSVWHGYLDTTATSRDATRSQPRDVTWDEFVWAYATVASRAVRFSSSRSDRSTWSGLYLEMVGDLLNHAPPRQLPPQLKHSENTRSEAKESGDAGSERAVPKGACAFRFLNEGDGCIQYHVEDGGVSQLQIPLSCLFTSTRTHFFVCVCSCVLHTPNSLHEPF